MNKQKKQWLENDNVVKVFSLLTAALCWVVVAFIINPTFTQNFSDVPVNIALRADALADLGLNPIEVSTVSVSAMVKGERLAVGRLQPGELTATVQIPANITEPGTYELKLVPVNSASDNDYEVVSYQPAVVSVKFDTYENRSFTIEPIVSGLSMPAGYILDKGPSVNPPQVVITGPMAEVDRIARCIVETTLSAPLEKTFADGFRIKLLDMQGNEINASERHLTLDNTEAQLIIPVLKEASLPLKIEFTHIPMGFPVASLAYSMSNNSVRVAGPVDVVDKYQKITLGYIDIRSLSINRSIYDFDVEMPASRFTNPENINSVTLTFNTERWSEASFNIGEANEIFVHNIPPRYTVTLLTEKIYNVLFTGDKDVLEAMSADDIVAEIDLSERDLSPGQYNYPVKISVPNRGLVWAVGEYSAVIQVAEKQASQ